jgi:diguanylate cyclase (GGDEF)-like protein/PAS domain S-box-containing protein
VPQKKKFKICDTFINHSSIVFFSWVTDTQWSVDYLSEGIRQFGYTTEEFLSGEKNYLHIIYPDDAEWVVREAETHTENGVKSFNLVYRIVTADGRIRWIDHHTVVARERREEGVCCVGAIMDITERKTIEQELIDSEAKFRTIAESTTVGFFIYQERFVYVNQAICDVSGYTQEELYDMNVWDFAHESSKERVKEIVLKRCRGEEVESRSDDLELVTKKGEIKIVRSMAHTVPYKGGWAGAGTIIDITDIAEAKEQVNLLAHAVKQTDDMVRITDRNGTITFANEAILKHSGYTLNEVIGQTPRIFKSGKHDKAFYRHLWKTILAGETYRGVFQNRKRDGTLYHEAETITPIRDMKNSVQYFVVTGKDISEQVAWENELHRQATTDALTGVYNRQKFMEELEAELDKFRRYNNTFTVIMVDIDHFKEINDTYGHDTGDKILKELSRLMNSSIRKTDLFARWGGEEFMILSPSLSYENAIVFAEKIRGYVESFVFDDINHLTVSIGITVPKEEDTFEKILKRVDKALYYSKNNGRNQVNFM